MNKKYGWLVLILAGLISVGVGIQKQRPVFSCHAARIDGGIKWQNEGQNGYRGMDGVQNPQALFQVGAKKKKTVALTFDDGPKAGTTDWLLEELAKRDVQATFFILGSQAALEESGEMMKRMQRDGHQIGCHTYHHVQMTLLSEAEQKKEIADWYAAVSEVIGDFSYCIRPPYGSVNNRVCACLNLPIILWSVDTEDWTGKKADEIADYIAAEAKDGDIILLHDIFEDSVQGAVAAIDMLQSRGFEFVTVNELLAEKGVVEEGGKVYRRISCADEKYRL